MTKLQSSAYNSWSLLKKIKIDLNKVLTFELYGRILRAGLAISNLK